MGLAWISYGQNMEPRHAQIAFPPCDAAVLVADAAVEWINENAPDAKVLITSSPKIPEVACKWEGAQKAVEEQTDATVVAVQEATNQQQGLQVTEAILQAHPGPAGRHRHQRRRGRGCLAGLQGRGHRPRRGLHHRVRRPQGGPGADPRRRLHQGRRRPQPEAAGRERGPHEHLDRPERHPRRSRSW